jgi:NAD(P)-dependent dehydrogenase (short-subunit alcohol dehydrogenase family)
MQGKVIVITGATNGIGLEAARDLAARGPALTLIGRNPEKTARVVDELKRETGNQSIDYVLGDLSLASEVRKVAAAVRERHDRLDVLVNNAGANFTSRHVTAEGLEMTFALNHLAYFVLTAELRDLLVASAPARIINVASSAHRGGRMAWDDLQGERSFFGFGRYCMSKLANILFTAELAKRLEGTGVTANSVHPGFVRTGFAKNDGAWAKVLVSIGGVVARSPRKGAEGIVHLATSPEVEGISGAFWMDRRQLTPSARARSVPDRERLWRETEAILARI